MARSKAHGWVAVGAATGIYMTVVALTGGFGSSSAAGETAPQKTEAAGPVDVSLTSSADRLGELDQLRNAAASSPQRYGGVATWGDRTVTLFDNGTGPDAKVDPVVAALRASGAQVTVKTCQYNLAQLNQVLAAVPSSSVFADNHVTLRSWGIDYEKNAVEIGVDALPAGFADKVASLWGGAAYLIVRPAGQLQ